MKVPISLVDAFGSEFELQIARFAMQFGFLPDIHALHSNRFLARSVIPHITKLSRLFNREEKDQDSGLSPYWKESSNPLHLRMAYFLYFMPSNLFRVAAIGSELSRLGFQWPTQNFQAIELGAGPASGACGIAAAQNFAHLGLGNCGTWALVEQDQSILSLGAQWATSYFSSLGLSNWGVRPFHRKIDLEKEFLPKNAPRFHLWLMSFYLNEITINPQELAIKLLRAWKNHLHPEGIAILVEPALKLQSRKLLELRKHLLLEIEKEKIKDLKILLPCLGHQACGALSQNNDWCHEEVTWWRPPYFRKIDQMAKLDRKTLPFSYLVLAKSEKKLEELLPRLKLSESHSPLQRHRLVSPAHKEGQDLEFFLCGEEGKRRARYRPFHLDGQDSELQRGDIFLNAQIRGDRNSSRIIQFKEIV